MSNNQNYYEKSLERAEQKDLKDTMVVSARFPIEDLYVLVKWAQNTTGTTTRGGVLRLVGETLSELLVEDAGYEKPKSVDEIQRYFASLGWNLDALNIDWRGQKREALKETINIGKISVEAEEPDEFEGNSEKREFYQEKMRYAYDAIDAVRPNLPDKTKKQMAREQANKQWIKHLRDKEERREIEEKEARETKERYLKRQAEQEEQASELTEEERMNKFREDVAEQFMTTLRIRTKPAIPDDIRKEYAEFAMQVEAVDLDDLQFKINEKVRDFNLLQPMPSGKWKVKP